MLSKSPKRNTFIKDKMIATHSQNGTMDSVKELIKMYEDFAVKQEAMEQDPEWQKNNLEYDLRTNDWILKKVRESDYYAKDLYSALCNNDFIKNDIWPILKEEDWGCSWRHAGGIIADMRQEGDYIDWYCAGNEGIITDEIREDLLKLGWIVRDNGFE